MKLPNNLKEAPLYFSPLFLVILSAFSLAYGIPLIIALVLVYLRHKKYRSIEMAELIQLGDIREKISSEQQHLIDLQEEYSQRVADYNNQYKELESDYKKKEFSLKKRYEDLSHRLAAESKKEQQALDAVCNAVDNALVTSEIDSTLYEQISSDEIKNKLSLFSAEEKDLQKNDGAIIFTGNTNEHTKSYLRKQKNQLLRSFNTETDNLIGNVTVRNIDSIRQKIIRSFEAHNKLFSIDNVQLTKAFLKIKLERMSCLYEYQKKLQEEKELFQVRKEQLREEEKVRHEMEMAKKKIEKDEAQFKHEIERTMKYLQKSSMDAEKQLYLDKIKELNEKLEKLTQEKESLAQREANAKAGYVYIISNIGSFGEDIYKIGMTRRLEPMDRIKELSSASVPFEFDVHALIFSDDAPALESLLHQHFRDMEVNKVNHRKEFFKVKLSEIENLVKEKYDKAVTFVEVPKAEEYRETLNIAQSAS